ncbi:phosphopantetheine-binding protein [Marinobacter profundi]|uniref:Acyl carrier protein n=1 Tax=Marinobacter profundi TaxID=2666256 RepID=A0A2G1UG92_9GAMM|nr:phosphopantetheine-binding protein [Marinobacter profundi]PHQ13521.1 acyl carrier protein [Marinobacter profundi]
MNREEAVKIVMSMLEKNVEDLEMSEDKMDKTLVDLGVDSLDIMLVIMDVGEAAGVSISDDEAEGLDTPEKIVDFILGR